MMKIAYIIASLKLIIKYCILISKRMQIILILFTKIINIIYLKQCLTLFARNNND